MIPALARGLALTVVLAAFGQRAWAGNPPRYLPKSPCESLLTQVIDLQVPSDPQWPQNIGEDADATVRSLYSIGIPGSSADPKSPSYISTPILSKLFHTQLRRLFVTKQFAHSWSSLEGVDVGAVDSKAFYDKAYSPEVYHERFSQLQKYFSTVFVTYALFRSDLNRHENLQIVDLGAGSGDSTSALRLLFPEARIAALDQSDAMLTRIIYRLPDVQRVHSDFETRPLPFADDSIDFAISICAAGQYLNPQAFNRLLLELERVLKPGGYFLMEYGDHGHTTAAFPSERFSAFKQRFARRGFEVEVLSPLRISIYGKNYYPILVRKPLEK